MARNLYPGNALRGGGGPGPGPGPSPGGAFWPPRNPDWAWLWEGGVYGVDLDMNLSEWSNMTGTNTPGGNAYIIDRGLYVSPSTTTINTDDPSTYYTYGRYLPLDLDVGSEVYFLWCSARKQIIDSVHGLKHNHFLGLQNGDSRSSFLGVCDIASGLLPKNLHTGTRADTAPDTSTISGHVPFRGLVRGYLVNNSSLGVGYTNFVSVMIKVKAGGVCDFTTAVNNCRETTAEISFQPDENCKLVVGVSVGMPASPPGNYVAARAAGVTQLLAYKIKEV